MTTRFSGGSMCGAVRYECAADPIAMAASFDDPSWYRPQAEIYTASAAALGLYESGFIEVPRAATKIGGFSG
jgi:hypothetical protein